VNGRRTPSAIKVGRSSATVPGCTTGSGHGNAAALPSSSHVSVSRRSLAGPRARGTAAEWGRGEATGRGVESIERARLASVLVVGRIEQREAAVGGAPVTLVDIGGELSDGARDARSAEEVRLARRHRPASSPPGSIATPEVASQ
jgi:hypothetical protein